MVDKQEVASMIKQLAEAILEIIAGVQQHAMWKKVATELVLQHGDDASDAIKKANGICDAFKTRFQTER